MLSVYREFLVMAVQGLVGPFYYLSSSAVLMAPVSFHSINYYFAYLLPYMDLKCLHKQRKVMGGRLVFWLPVIREDYRPELVHSGLSLPLPFFHSLSASPICHSHARSPFSSLIFPI